MPESEFSVIHHYFARQSLQRDDVVVGIGDDCAVLSVPDGLQLVLSMDLLVAGTHFFPDTDPAKLGHKALAVNLSDLAAQGATPAWATLGLSLPSIEHAWLEGFCQGFFVLAAEHNMQLIGGDTTRGPLMIVIQAHGFIKPQQSLGRDKAQPGDRIFVTGTLGDAAAGLALLAKPQEIITTSAQQYLVERLYCPVPRIQAGQALAGVANAAIDISDGLAQDLGHILNCSQVGARLFIEQLPLSAQLLQTGSCWQAREFALTGGDDYELCFTVPAAKLAQLQALAVDWPHGYSEIGVIESEPGLRCIAADGSPYNLQETGYDHFS